MASSNRHWPSMFKSKPHHHNQWQHDHINSSLISTPAFHRGPPFSSGCEERSPEPKPRWNPKPEQIRILEAIFNSGMVNPPRDEIRKIRAQLQEYGQVGDANVFYWFQNRKSRSKHKNRHHALQNPKTAASETQNPKTTSSSNISIIPSSSSSSSDKSSPQENTVISSPTVSMNHQPYFFTSSQGELIAPDPFLFQMQQQQQQQFSQEFCFSDLSNVVQMGDHHQETVGCCNNSGFLLSELMMNHTNNNNIGGLKKVEEEKMKLQHELIYSNAHNVPSMATTTSSSTIVTVPPGVNQVQGVGESGGRGSHHHPLVASERSMVFINEVAFEVSVEGFNVRECFGDDAVLIHSSGQPVLTNEWGLTIQPLIHGASYYLI